MNALLCFIGEIYFANPVNNFVCFLKHKLRIFTKN